MRPTRYYSKKQDTATFFAKCPKDDQNPDVQDGRIVRHSEYGGQKYETLGWEVAELEGIIESMYITDMPSGERLFCIGLQAEDGVDVLQCDFNNAFGGMNNDVAAIALRHESIDLEFPVKFTIYQGRPNKHGRKPCYLNVFQLGKTVWPSFERDHSGGPFDYIGVPQTVVGEKMGKTTYDTAERDQFLYEILKGIIKKVDDLNRKDDREPTPAEASKASIQGIEEDVPF